MPYACDLAAVPVGSWAEYELNAPEMPTRTEKKAAVARKPEGITIETTHASRPELVIAALLSPGEPGDGLLRRLTIQDGDYEPMDSPVTQKQRPAFLGLDSLTLIGEDDVSIRAGTFHTRRYRYQTSFDETVEVWINDTVWPICVVKLDAELKQPWVASGRFSYELLATGTGATPQITRSAIPFDVEILKKRARNRVRGPGLPPPAPGDSKPR